MSGTGLRILATKIRSREAGSLWKSIDMFFSNWFAETTEIYHIYIHNIHLYIICIYVIYNMLVVH